VTGSAGGGVPARRAAAGMLGGLAATVVLLAATVAPLAAQVPARPGALQQDTTLTPDQRIRERLRALGAPVARDTVDTDTIAPAADRPGPRLPGRPVEGVTGMTRDSVMEALLRVPGFQATEFKGEQVRWDAAARRLELLRAAEVTQDGQRLSADSTLVYDERIALFCAHGTPTVSGAGVTAPVVSDSLCYNMETRVGVAYRANTVVSEGADWRVRGERFVFVDDDYYGHRAIFTDCDLDVPHYHFSARDLKVVRGNVIVARNVTMNFQDVPVFWLPFLVQSLETGRRSGLLMPRFSVNDVVRNSTRYNRRIEDVGFYWAINDYMGTELALGWFSNNYTELRGSFDYRWARRFLQGGLTYRQFWEEGGRRTFTTAARNEWEPDERTRVSLNANYTTSANFVRDFTFDPRELNRSIDSRLGVNRRFGWGSVQMSGSRNQFLSDNTVTTVLPDASVNFSTVTLFPALPGETRFYNNMTWTGSASARVERRDIGEEARDRRAQGRRDMTNRLGSNFSLGSFSWSQTFSYTDELRSRREFGTDTLPALPERSLQRGEWSTSLNYQQRLVGTSTLTPGIALRGGLLRGDTTGGTTIHAPTRMDFNARLQTDLYGFLPGVGAVERVRHRLSPSFTYSYSPRPQVTEEQRNFFNVTDIREQNRLSIGLNQTFEAKVRRPEGAAEDTLPSAGPGGGPRRIPRNPPITVLSLTTDAVVYDFVQARDGYGVQTTTLSNSLTSDLLRGLQVSITHDLFRTLPLPEGSPAGARLPREFAPHLSQVNMSFSLSNESWLARLLGLSGRREERRPAAEPDTAAVQPPDAARDFSLVGRQRRTVGSGFRGTPGAWNASLNYTMFRPRGDTFGTENQQVTAMVNFQPTQNWSLNWNTGYSFTRGEFTDHILTLTRTMHDWDANFDFVKAQNGNFSFQFRVHLRANPDIKVDYEQREQRAREQRPF
jgi:hypothetical protein